jgi:hypothetical protein
MPSLVNFAPELVGFFSYARHDASSLHLAALRRAIAQELSAQLGRRPHSFRIWQDRAVLPSGDLWPTEMKAAVRQSVFFIPIVTPWWAASQACALELEAFLEREAELGRDDLVFPIVCGGNPETFQVETSASPAFTIIRQRQYADWRRLWLREPESREVHEAVAGYCAAISQTLRRPWETPDQRRARTAASDLSSAPQRQGRLADAGAPVGELERIRADVDVVVVSLDSDGGDDQEPVKVGVRASRQAPRLRKKDWWAGEPARPEFEPEPSPAVVMNAAPPEYPRASSRRTRGRRLWLLAGAGAVSAASAGALAVLYSQPNFDSGPVVSAPNLPQPVPSIPTQPVFNNACAAPSGQQFRDGFNTRDAGWGPDSEHTSISADGLVISPAQGQTIVRLYQPLRAGSTWLCAQLVVPVPLAGAAPASGAEAGAGLVFWATDDRNYYSVLLSPTGDLVFQRTVDGAESPLAKLPKAPQLLFAPNMDTLQVALAGPTMTAFVNGKQALSFNGQPPSADSMFGLYGRSGPKSVTWQFRSFAVLHAAPAPQTRPQRRTKKGPVDVSIFSRTSGAPGDRLLVRVFFHEPKARGAIAREARGADPQARRRAVRTLQTDVAHGQELEVRLEADGLIIDHPIQMFAWSGEAAELPFVLTLPADAEGRSYAIVAHLLVDAVSVGKISFTIEGVAGRIAQSAPGLPPTEAVRYQKAFISYAHEDRLKALDGLLYLRAAGLDVFQDVDSLRAGDDWWEKITEKIDESQIFFLFWSRHAAASEMVKKEAIYAYERYIQSGKKNPQVTPILLEGPPSPAAPPELTNIHFNDRTRYIIAAEALARMAQKQ